MTKILHSNNTEPIRVSERDMRKIGRGYEIGHSFGMVRDLDSKQMYVAYQASCSLPSCACAVVLKKAGQNA